MNRNIHLPPGVSEFDLGAGGSLPGSWVPHWQADPARIALSTLDNDAITGGEILDRTSDRAARFAGAGLGAGDRVLLCGPTSLDYVLTYVAALRAGLAVVPANPGLSGAELVALARAAT